MLLAFNQIICLKHWTHNNNFKTDIHLGQINKNHLFFFWLLDAAEEFLKFGTPAATLGCMCAAGHISGCRQVSNISSCFCFSHPQACSQHNLNAPSFPSPLSLQVLAYLLDLFSLCEALLCHAFSCKHLLLPQKLFLRDVCSVCSE